MWWDDRRLGADQAERYARRLEATGQYHCVVFPLAGDLALLHVVERSDVWPEAFLFRTAAECEALLARGAQARVPQPGGARQLPLWDAAG